MFAAERYAPDLWMVLVALLSSPRLGPAVWRPVAESLALLGWVVKTAPAGEQAPTGPGDVLRTFLAALPADGDLVLVAHSNAGLYVPALIQERRVVANVFVDAGLPVRNGRVPLAPPAFRDFLRQRSPLAAPTAQKGTRLRPEGGRSRRCPASTCTPSSPQSKSLRPLTLRSQGSASTRRVEP